MCKKIWVCTNTFGRLVYISGSQTTLSHRPPSNYLPFSSPPFRPQPYTNEILIFLQLVYQF